MPSSPDSSSTPTRQLWLVIWGVLTVAPIGYAVIAQLIEAPLEPATMWSTLRAVFFGMSALAFVAATFLMSRAADAGGWPPGASGPSHTPDLAPPATFQVRSLIAMALFESIAIYGFVLVLLGGPRLHILPWTAASGAGLLAIVLPKGLAYWRRWEMASAGARPSAIG